MVRVFRRKQFSIYSDKAGHFVIHNMNKEFNEGHTHINNFNTAKFLINLAIHKSIPRKELNTYLYKSLIRISTDSSYIFKLEKKIEDKKRR